MELPQRLPEPVTKMGAVIIGGNYRSLGMVRSLGRHGIPVWVLVDQHRVAATSRYCARSLAWPESAGRHQVDYLVQLAEAYPVKGWLLIPSGDADLGLVARHRELLSQHYRVAAASWDVVRWGADKRLTHQLAKKLDIGYPLTHYPDTREELEGLQCAFPVILKPTMREGINPFLHSKAWRVDNHAELVARYDEACALVDPGIVMVQELIPGGGESQFSYAALCSGGEPLASVVARRTRQFPVDFGRASSFVETVDQPQVEELSIRLLAALSYTGLAEIEYKMDCRDGSLKLLDFNPRIWGWHTLSQGAGVDFPYLM